MVSSTSALATKDGVRNSPAANANLILFSIVECPPIMPRPIHQNEALRGNYCRPIATELAEIAYSERCALEITCSARTSHGLALVNGLHRTSNQWHSRSRWKLAKSSRVLVTK